MRTAWVVTAAGLALALATWGGLSWAAAAETRPEAAQAASASNVLTGFDQVPPADLGEVSVVAGASPGGVKVGAIDLRRAGVHVEYRGKPEPSTDGEGR